MLNDTPDTVPNPRDGHIQAIAGIGRRRAWPKASDYTHRTTVAGQIGRWKQVPGPVLRFHVDAAHATEVAIGALVLNRMLDLGRSNSVRVA